jgi:peptidoglycan/LPS O-acetylase OafA/YrhL
VGTRSAASPEKSAQSSDHAVPLSRYHLAALDGTRFIAAFCVLLGHGYWYVVAQQNSGLALDPLSRVMIALPGLGMTLFFVLSGFVIHFNYHHTVGIGRPGTFDFFVARFSRLYPLFLAVFAIDFFQLLWFEGYLNGNPRLDFDLFGPLPYFLSFTQTWLFIPFDGHALYDHYGYLTSNAQATGAMWSLSTEWLFYMVYPLFSNWLSRRNGRSLGALAVAVTSAGLCYYVWAAYHIPLLKNFGAALFVTPALADSFVGWVVFYSPAGRIVEFLIGACAAQQYLAAQKDKDYFSRWPSAACAAVAVAVIVWITASSIWRIDLSGVNASCAAALVAVFVFLVARYRTSISRALSAPILVKCGEASYSLYLLHFYTMHQWAAKYAAGFTKSARISVFLAGILLSIALSRTVYLLFERPALRWLRDNFRPLKLHIAIGAVFAVTTLFCIAASIQIHTIWRSCATTASTNCIFQPIGRQ